MLAAWGSATCLLSSRWELHLQEPAGIGAPWLQQANPLVQTKDETTEEGRNGEAASPRQVCSKIRTNLFCQETGTSRFLSGGRGGADHLLIPNG